MSKGERGFLVFVHIHIWNKENMFATAHLGFGYFILLNKGKAMYRSQKRTYIALTLNYVGVSLNFLVAIIR